MMARKGISQQMAKLEMRRRTTLIGAMLVQKGEADGMICGTVSTTHRHLHFIDQVIGKKEGTKVYAAMNALVLPGRQIFIVDTHVNVDPTPEQLAEITMLAAEEVKRFGIVRRPRRRCAMCSRSCANARPISTWTAKCTAMSRSTRACARKCCPNRRSKATRIC
jgi:phosphotransacetylase